MNAKVFGAVIVSALLGWAPVSFAQTSYGSGEAARCNTMSGDQKEQCLRDEATKTQGSTDNAAGRGATSDAAKPDQKYGQAGSCDTMTGAEKDKCLQEARKDASPATSKTGD